MRTTTTLAAAGLLLLTGLTGLGTAPANAATVPTCAGKTATIVGTDGDDTLVGTPRDDVIVGLGGNDTITGLGGDDTICAGSNTAFVDRTVDPPVLHAEHVDGGPGDDHIYGGSGINFLDGGAGADFIEGGDAPELRPFEFPKVQETLLGGTGDDVLTGRGGEDVLQGGPGDDRLSGGPGNDVAEGGTGNDAVSGSRGWDFVSGGPGRDRLLGGPGKDVVSDHDPAFDSSQETAPNTLFGNTGDDIVEGSRGKDLIYGGGGDDDLLGDNGSDDLRGGPGDDELRGDDGNDRLSGGPGIDLANYAFDSTSNGNYRSETHGVHLDLRTGVATGVGHDRLIRMNGAIEGQGEDHFYGDSSNNRFVVVTHPNEQREVFDGRGGSDTIDVYISAPLRIDLVTNELTATRVRTSIPSIENVKARFGGATIIGDKHANRLVGGTGADVIRGGGGDDALFGLRGDDILDGGSGTNTIDGGTGDDTCRHPSGGKRVTSC